MVKKPRYFPFKQHQALCYLSVCVLPDKAIPVMLDITKRISMSHSYKTKMSMLEYVQVITVTECSYPRRRRVFRSTLVSYLQPQLLLKVIFHLKTTVDGHYKN
jgi:hypothetical protein